MILEVLLCAWVTAPPDTVLAPAVATAVKQEWQPGVQVTRISSEELQEVGVTGPKGLNDLVPNLHLPDYGASLTSTIYVRGFGSRMENPVMGLYIDDFPILDKNSYDLDYLDVASLHFLHGPQGTLYGRNALQGVLSVRTQMRKGLHLSAELGRDSRIQLSGGSGNHSWSAAYRHSFGFFRNAATGRICDPFDGGQLRWRWEKSYAGVQLSNLLQASFSDEGGFAYGAWKDGQLQPVNYNDPAGYRRLTVLEGFKARMKTDHVRIDMMASFQVLGDHMRMDQDYTPELVFTLQQKQLSGAQTFEVVLKPLRSFKYWKPSTGVFGFFKANRMDAPVLFKEAGIRKLILDNANAGIPNEIGHLEIPDTEFPVNSHFDILSWNAALYHESVFTLGRWQLTAGLRLDYEGAWMAYDCRAGLHYRMVPFMPAARAYQDTYTGDLGHGSLQLLPKLAVQYDGPGNWQAFGSVTKGYRAGGFNTQIFSDILQHRMMNGLMADLGVYLDRPTVSVLAGHTEYQPEEMWNVEAGARYRGKHFTASATLFYAHAVNQQLTVFPPGMTTGRMMTNAGRSRSLGAELEASYRKGAFHARASWGWNDARFIEFHDGQADYAGKRIPYSPAHTLFASAGYSWPKIDVQLHLRGTGPIAWNEDNSLTEPFYLTLGAQLRLTLDRLQLYLRGENLSGTRYRSFYFKSMGNVFFQASKPVLLSLGVNFTIS